MLLAINAWRFCTKVRHFVFEVFMVVLLGKVRVIPNKNG